MVFPNKIKHQICAFKNRTISKSPPKSSDFHTHREKGVAPTTVIPHASILQTSILLSFSHSTAKAAFLSKASTIHAAQHLPSIVIRSFLVVPLCYPSQLNLLRNAPHILPQNRRIPSVLLFANLCPITQFRLARNPLDTSHFSQKRNSLYISPSNTASTL